MLPDNLHIGPIAIHWFGIFLALAILASWAVLDREFARLGLAPDLATSTVVWATIGGIAGARLWVIAEGWSDFVRHPMSFVLTGAGLAWFGGLIGGVLAVTWFFRLRRIPWLMGADAVGPALVLGQAIGRIGCQVSGDGDWGVETTLPWGMAYPHAVVGWDKPPGVRVHPTPIYECLAYLAIFGVLWRGRRGAPLGTTFAKYLILAGIARFLVEFVRINPRVFLGLSTAQLMSLASIAAGAVLLARRGPRPAARPAVR